MRYNNIDRRMGKFTKKCLISRDFTKKNMQYKLKEEHSTYHDLVIAN